MPANPLWWLYQLGVGLAMTVATPFLLLGRGGHYRATLRQRLGAYGAGSTPGALWLHAVSVGEVAVAAILARALPADLPLLVTTVTPTGQDRARALFAGRATVAYFPFDLGVAVRRFFTAFAPRALVLVEGDFWPLVLHAARRRGLPIAVVNGRVSDRTFPRLRAAGVLARPLLDPVDRYAVQTEEDRRRLLRLGVAPHRLEVTGNLKFDSPAPPVAAEAEAVLRSAAGERPILVAGSTMRGEEEPVLEAFAAAGGPERALLVLAPRHPERWGEVAELIERRGFAGALRTRLDPAARPSVVLLDTLGELAHVYGLGVAAFVGGTLVPTGGHNPLEPARFAVPIAAGPSMENFREIAEAFDAAAAWTRVANADELAAAWRSWLSDPDAARALGRRGADVLTRHRGALERTVRFLEPLLAAVSRRAGAAEARP